MQKIDRRILNLNYAQAPVDLFVALARFMHRQEPNDACAGVPKVLYDGMTIMQAWESCPSNSGCVIYYRLAADKPNVALIFDCEAADWYWRDLGEDPCLWQDQAATSEIAFTDCDDLYTKLRSALYVSGE